MASIFPLSFTPHQACTTHPPIQIKNHKKIIEKVQIINKNEYVKYAPSQHPLSDLKQE